MKDCFETKRYNSCFDYYRPQWPCLTNIRPIVLYCIFIFKLKQYFLQRWYDGLWQYVLTSVFCAIVTRLWYIIKIRSSYDCGIMDDNSVTVSVYLSLVSRTDDLKRVFRCVISVEVDQKVHKTRVCSITTRLATLTTLPSALSDDMTATYNSSFDQCFPGVRRVT